MRLVEGFVEVESPNERMLLDDVIRCAPAMALHARGMSYEQIAEILGITIEEAIDRQNLRITLGYLEDFDDASFAGLVPRAVLREWRCRLGVRYCAAEEFAAMAETWEVGE